MKPSGCSFATAWLCGAGLSAGLCFCVCTSFLVPADALWLALACLFTALYFSSVFLLPKSWVWLLATAVLAGTGIYALRREVFESLSALLYAVSSQYAEAISGMQTILLTEGAASADATLSLILFAAVCSLLCVWSVMRGKSLVFLLLFTIPVLALCLVILQTPPAVWAILLVVGVLALLLLTQLLRVRQPGEGNRLALLLSMPLALMIGLLAVLFPAKTYTRAAWSDSLQHAITTAADKLTLFRRDAQTGQLKFTSPLSPSTLGSYLWDSSVTSVNLNRVGPQLQFGRSVMRIKSQIGGLCHLRGDSMAVYEDNRWKSLSDADYRAAAGAENALLSGINPVSWNPQMEIETDMKSGIYYLPYYPTEFPSDAAPVSDAYVKNPLQQTSYSISYLPDMGVRSADETYAAFVHDVYTQVPDETRQALSDILADLGAEPGGNTAMNVAAVLAYVSTSASYDLNTPSVPAGEDFVSWFLHDSDTGYCVHFATAATILLRCLDVPARYVTGYYTSLEENSWTTVTSDDAHAWVEVYLDGEGWYPLDPTPAAPEEPEETGAQAAQIPDESPAADDQTPAPDLPTPPEAPSGGQSAVPGASAVGAESSERKLSVFIIIFSILAIAGVLLLWRAMLFSIRQTALGKGRGNRRAVALYHHVCWLSRHTKQPVPEEFLILAEKGRFSQHKLTSEELRPMQEYAQQQTALLLADKRLWKQFVYRVLYALG